MHIDLLPERIRHQPLITLLYSIRFRNKPNIIIESEAKRKDVANNYDPAQDKEFVPDNVEGEGTGGKPEEPDPEEIKEVFKDDKVDNEDIESKVSIEDDDD